MLLEPRTALSKLCTLALAVFLATMAWAVLAQQPGVARSDSPPSAATHLPSAEAMARAPAASSTSLGKTLGYRSVFEGYRSFSEQPVLPWRESNELVGRIGGWQSYAREGQGGPAAGSDEKGTPVRSGRQQP